jgi:hypothetical protein
MDEKENWLVNQVFIKRVADEKSVIVSRAQKYTGKPL